MRIADPESLAKALLHFLTDSYSWREAVDSGRARVKKYYDQNQMFENYRNIYTTGLQKWQA